MNKQIKLNERNTKHFYVIYTMIIILTVWIIELLISNYNFNQEIKVLTSAIVLNQHDIEELRRHVHD